MADPATILKNTLEVQKHLQRQGWKVKKSKLYNDAKAGKLSRGECSVDEAEKYAVREKLPRLVDVDTGELSRQAKEKNELEIRKLKNQNEQLEFELAKSKGSYIPRDQFEQELAARASVLLHGLRNMAQGRAPVYFEVAQESGVQALADAVQADIEDLLNDYANRESFQVIVLPEEIDAAGA